MRKLRTDLKTPEQLINFFARIPASMWCTEVCQHADGRSCALGHLGAVSLDADERALPLYSMFGSADQNFESWQINDGGNCYDTYGNRISFEELGDDPKERTLNALLLKSSGLWEFASYQSDDDTGEV